MKKFLCTTLLYALVSQLSFADIQHTGVQVKYTDSNDDEKIAFIQRKKPQACQNVIFSPQSVFGDNYASKDVPEHCKRTFVTFYGKISPMVMDEEIKTQGELEVMQFIKDAQKDKNKLLIDSRTEPWYLKFTIAGAVNMPYIYLNPSQYPEEFEEILAMLNVKKTQKGYDFSNAKSILLFCNGAWCAQSSISIRALVKLGYPKEKMQWYRGGIQSWVSLGLPTIVP